MTFQKFLKRVERQKTQNPGLRYGQVLVHELEEYRPLLAAKIRESCYYLEKGDHMTEIVNKLEGEWNDE